MGFALLSVVSLAAPLHEEDGLAIGNVERSAEPEAMALESRLQGLEKRLASLDMGTDLFARDFTEYGAILVSGLPTLHPLQLLRCLSQSPRSHDDTATTDGKKKDKDDRVSHRKSDRKHRKNKSKGECSCAKKKGRKHSKAYLRKQKARKEKARLRKEKARKEKLRKEKELEKEDRDSDKDHKKREAFPDKAEDDKKKV